MHFIEGAVAEWYKLLLYSEYLQKNEEIQDYPQGNLFNNI